MSCFNNIIPRYEYNYFDKYNQLQTKQLNIFQCAIRKVFGCYVETHLSNVAKKAYTVTLNDQFQSAPTKRQELLKLIAKAESVYGDSQSYIIQLPNCNLSNSREVTISVRYDIRKPTSDNYKISSINFKLIFSRNNRVRETYNISIFKNKSQQIVVHLPSNLFQGLSNDTKDSIKQRLNGEHAKIVTNLLAKILNDSLTSPEMSEIQYYASDHRWMFRGLDHRLLRTGPGPDELNNAQEKAMNQLGWEYLHQFTKLGQIAVNDAKRVYLFRKEAAEKNQNLVDLGFNQQLSTAFASSCLETQTREY